MSDEMTEIVDFLNRYLDAEYALHLLDVKSTKREPIYDGFMALWQEFCGGKGGILMLNDFLWGKNPPSPAMRKEEKAELHRRPLFKVERYGKGKSEIIRAVCGYYKDWPRKKQTYYSQAIFVRRKPKLAIFSVYRLGPHLFSHGLINWEFRTGEKVAPSKLGKLAEVAKLRAPTEKASRADYEASGE